jgi:hypothetical protein
VGQSKDVKERVTQHFSGKGSAWTKLHAPTSLLHIRPAGTDDQKVAELQENQFVIMLMMQHGWERVRGGFWCHVSEDETRKNLIHHQFGHVLEISRPIEASR